MGQEKASISIIIPHWNGIEILSDCLESLKKSNFKNFETIVVDNASTDGSQDWVKENYPNIILVELKENKGYAGGCNKGTEHANGEYFLFLNNDTVQSPDWLNHLIKKMENNSSIAAIQPKIKNYFKRDLFDYAGGSGGHMDLFCYPFSRGRLFDHQEKDIGQYDSAVPCFWASGTAILVRKHLFDRVGGFDESFFAHMEEIDLCWRFNAMGYEVWVEPKAVVYHKNAVSLPMYTHRKYYLNHRNSLIMLLSNYSFSLAFYLGTIRIILDFIALFYSIIKVDLNHFTGVIRALFWVFLHPQIIFRRRKHFKSFRKSTDKIILNKLYRGSVVIAYYLLRKKTYLDIKSRASW